MLFEECDMSQYERVLAKDACVGCVFNRGDFLGCSRLDGMECYDRDLDLDYIFIKKEQP